MKIRLNGQWEEHGEVRLSVLELLQKKGTRPELVAVEVNLDLIPRAEQAQVWLKDGDEVEIVRCVGGG